MSTVTPYPKVLTSQERRHSYHRGLMAESAVVLSIVEQEGREALVERLPEEINALLRERDGCLLRGDLRSARVIDGRVDAWKFQKTARRD